MAKPIRKPRDFAQRAFSIVQQATGQTDPLPPPRKPTEKNAAAVALGKLGGKKGGKARAAKLSAKRLSAIGRKGAKARWKNDKSV